ncbi:hypothetical protein LO763_20265 [Glycomyces sp. A-F 0318]|uniref:effector-associated constant component EACC1 n=1 Tax=Glycomyces amatae TaxID=2881355 RepID=UPI001E3D6096|nr:hypothetical protein [Glycomyces amatae]MCD0445949.1 hypothetical protein [Glycomyces amatae]
MILKMLGVIATAILIPAALMVLAEWSPRIAQRLLHWTAARLGDEQVAGRYLEEWQGDLRDTPSGLSQLLYALSRVVRLPLMARELNVVLVLRTRLPRQQRNNTGRAAIAASIWQHQHRILTLAMVSSGGVAVGAAYLAWQGSEAFVDSSLAAVGSVAALAALTVSITQWLQHRRSKPQVVITAPRKTLK